ncbi:hypothetical protein BGL34_00165 [Fructilactobacillus lindneri]|uniref:YokE-like PH domain-containing protein n=2 Tax=Fructilactobacillus lindneri TaxID=53444 RepID=A0A0R2JQ26_9LACO|nr:histidine decarboxylase maturation protein HdcB [Fructilactobacillus lindneri]ANZ58387.1 hypothetical protein AYR60_06415 [Fructilactobacillus lindneri]ANZ59709.1 hypothetical protein AYR59_06670 [Fructilactobacillus lindneri]KRN79227.1 hypothetical protein IV52_GL000634 [Fructilactobacillus lindneri DSM 20690 = JCM 11027]POG98509.1 hypothetical protein BGL31_00755 [Fructilactobacillus lindneri]POH03897.1 hypothetical protein BGL32_00695 [Fructilactobacillus lindneri]
MNVKIAVLENQINADFYQTLQLNYGMRKINSLLLGKIKQKEVVLLATKNLLILAQKDNTKTFPLNQVRKLTFIKGTPNGEIQFKFGNHVYKVNQIRIGRVFDFVQTLKPTLPLEANYTNTNRGENNYLSNPDHAVEIDRLRTALQNGKISRYEYDDFNGSISKAGK